MSLLILLVLLASTDGCILASRPKKHSVLPKVNVFGGGTRTVFYHDLTAVVFDVNRRTEIIDCELISVPEVGGLSKLFNYLWTRQIEEVGLDEMLAHMKTCDSLEDDLAYSLNYSLQRDRRMVVLENKSSVLMGIVPGTNWCGRGDLAQSYADLGEFRNVDRCCRAHDFCPVNVPARSSRYGLENISSMTKSHCTCDYAFYQCLKKINDRTANLVGRVYFNVLRPECIQEDWDTRLFVDSGLRF